MVFWLALALMTAAAAFAASRPLWRPARVAAPDNDLAVYRDQLAEIDRDLSEKRIAPADAEAARAEVSRRLIAAAERAENAMPREKPAAKGVAHRWRFACVMASIALPLGALGLYLTLGSPGLPGQPLAERLARARSADDAAAREANTLASLVARVESHLERNPDDGRGWEVLAPVYMRFERYDEAVKARGHAIRLLGVTAERVAALGEAMVAAAGGIVTPAAKAQFERALQLDRRVVTASLYLGLAAKQAGDREEARRVWEGMIAQAPAGAEWVGFVRQAIAGLGDGAGPAGGAGEAAGENANGAASGVLSPEQRDLARGMVERLAARLAENGSDVDEWLRLVRSYLVLGERDKAQAAALDARRALAGDPDKLQRLDSGVKALGVEG